MPDDHLHDNMAPRSFINGLVTLDLVGLVKLALAYVVMDADDKRDMKPSRVVTHVEVCLDIMCFTHSSEIAGLCALLRRFCLFSPSR